MDKYKEFLSKKVLGVKVLYLVFVLAIVLGFFAWKMKSAGVDAGAQDIPTDGTDTGTGDVGSDVPTTVTPTDSSLGIGSGGVSTGGVTTDPVYTPPPTPEVPTNDTWLRMGVDWLIKQGVDSSQAAMALQAYLAGDQLSYEQGQLKERVIKQFGLPPELPQVGGTANKPTTPKPPPKVTPGTQKPPLEFKTTASINTLTEIAKKFYGSSADRYVDLLQAHNMTIPRHGPYKVGTRVFVPVKSEPLYYIAKRGHTTLAQIAAANGVSTAVIKELNDKTKFPVAVGHKVRVA